MQRKACSVFMIGLYSSTKTTLDLFSSNTPSQIQTLAKSCQLKTNYLSVTIIEDIMLAKSNVNDKKEK